MAKPELFTKEQLAEPSGVSLDTIDLYVACDLLRPLHLNDGVFFTTDDMLRLEITQKGKRLGFALGEIKQLIDNATHQNTKRRS